MRNINKVILIGNVARPPEVRVTNGGQKMATFILATNRTWYDPYRQKQSQAEFHNMLAWGKIAEICEKFLQKSTLVYIEGYLKTRSWENEENTRFYRTEIVIQDILVLDRGIRHTKDGVEGLDVDEDLQFFEPENDEHHFDFDPEATPSQKSASDIEKSIHEKLSAGNMIHADATLSHTGQHSGGVRISLDEPLFEEEAK